jgi:hypothetical protein
MTTLVGTLEGAAEISMSIQAPVVKATGLLSSLLSIVLVTVEMVIAVDIIPGSWAFRLLFICARLMGGVAEWSITLFTLAIKEEIAEGAPPISKVVEWSAVVLMLALVAKEGITEGSTNKGAALISGVVGWSPKTHPPLEPHQQCEVL